MKVFAGGIATESNTFAAAPTGLAAYLANGVHRVGQGAANEYSPMLDTLRRLADDQGHELVIGFAAYAEPGGTTTAAAYAALKGGLLASLVAALPVDAVILPLHGAMVAEGCDSCESDIVEAVRGIVGAGVPIGVELDLHCHFTEVLRTVADIVVAYKEYPHTDVAERLAEVWRLTLAVAEGELVPVTKVFDCRMVSYWHTTSEPMHSFVQRMASFEGRDGVLSVNFGHGFEYADVPEAGAKVWVVSDARVDRDGAHAARLAETLGREIFALREQTRPRRLDADAALDRLAAARPGRPLVIADVADNAGGGASSDSTFVLRRLVERGIGGVAIGAFWDLGAVHICRSVGPGAVLDLRIGGKCGPASGAPLDVRVTVRVVATEHAQSGLGARFDCGPSVWVVTDGGIDIVLVSRRQQVVGTDLFTGLGIELEARRGVVVKSAQHFHAAFAPLASAIVYAATPGLMREDFENMAYRRRSLNYWPRVDDPWHAAHA